MFYGIKSSGGRSPNPLSGRIGSGKFGMLFFEMIEFLQELVVFVVGYFRLVKDVVEVVVAADLFSQFINFACYFAVCH